MMNENYEVLDFYTINVTESLDKYKKVYENR